MSFSRGYAFIVEGETEKVFYIELLKYLAQKYHVTLERSYDADLHEYYFWFSIQDKFVIIKLNSVGTITKIPNSYNWFCSQCIEPYSPDCIWRVFLCYDTDNYVPDISKFHKGDWAFLRSSLEKSGAVDLFDLDASADIEDVLLQDLDGVCRYLGCKKPDKLLGNSGKKKMISLYKKCGKIYHEGTKARELIKSLDMETIIKGDIIHLHHIEKEIFQKNE